MWIRSDTCWDFSHEDLQKVEKACGITHTFRTVYHPQFQGKVESANELLNKKLVKIMGGPHTRPSKNSKLKVTILRKPKPFMPFWEELYSS